LNYLDPEESILINGVPTFRSLISRNHQLSPQFRDILKISKVKNKILTTSAGRQRTELVVATGTIAQKFGFIGFPFLSGLRRGVSVNDIIDAITEAHVHE
jgi:hypothetical protein